MLNPSTQISAIPKIRIRRKNVSALNVEENLSSHRFEVPNRQNTQTFLEICKLVQDKLKPKRTRYTDMKCLQTDFEDARKHLESGTKIREENIRTLI